MKSRAELHVVPDTPPTAEQTLNAALTGLIDAHDRAEALARETKQKLRPLLREYADQRGQVTIATLEQARRELCA